MAACVCMYVYGCALLEKWVYVLCYVSCISLFLPTYCPWLHGPKSIGPWWRYTCSLFCCSNEKTTHLSRSVVKLSLSLKGLNAIRAYLVCVHTYCQLTHIGLRHSMFFFVRQKPSLLFRKSWTLILLEVSRHLKEDHIIRKHLEQKYIFVYEQYSWYPLYHCAAL